MKHWNLTVVLGLATGLTISSILIAQPATEVTQTPIYIRPSSDINAIQPMDIKVSNTQGIRQSEVAIPASQDENPYLVNDPTSLLPMLSDMLNEGAADRTAVSFEALRRKAMMRSSGSLTSAFLLSEPVKKSK